MKALFLSIVISVLPLAESAAQTITPNGVRFNRIQSCDFWSYVSNNGIYGYLCSSYPSSLMVPDAYDTNQVLDKMALKIQELEKRLEALEKGQPTQPNP